MPMRMDENYNEFYLSLKVIHFEIFSIEYKKNE